MRSSDFPEVVVLARHDLQAAQRLVAAAGWNQVVADWEMFLEDGRIFGCKDEQGRIVATAATMPYRQVGWISLMLVDEAWRRRGLATRLMSACIETLEPGSRRRSTPRPSAAKFICRWVFATSCR